MSQIALSAVGCIGKEANGNKACKDEYLKTTKQHKNDVTIHLHHLYICAVFSIICCGLVRVRTEYIGCNCLLNNCIFDVLNCMCSYSKIKLVLNCKHLQLLIAW